MKKSDKKSVLGWIYNIFKSQLFSTAIMCICTVAVSLSLIWLAFLSKNVLEIATGDLNGNFGKIAILFAVIVIAQVLLSGVHSLLKTSISGKFTINLREHLFNQLHQKEYSELQKYHSGDILNRFTSDTEVVVSNTVTILPDIFSILTKIIGGTVALVALEPSVAVIIIVLGILIPSIGRIIKKRYKHLHKECQRTEGTTRAFLQECFENNIVLKTFESQSTFANRLKDYMTENFSFKMKRALISVLSHLSLYSFFTIGYYAILVWGATKISNGTLTFGSLIAFLQLVSQLRNPLQNVSNIFPKYFSLIASAERLRELENLPDEPRAQSNDNLEFSTLSGDCITFSYDNKPVLSDFSFKIQKGSITAITGPSGIGKSTLFKLILGLYGSYSGTLLVNNQIALSPATRNLFAYVPQGNLILSGTIRENVTLCNSQIPENDIINACKTAEIHDYIATLPEGYDTVLSERGGGLSEGQIQRLSIARALLANTPVLLLDEATSALDSETELRLLQNIKQLKNKTVILVTHRKQSIEFCDNLINI